MIPAHPSVQMHNCREQVGLNFEADTSKAVKFHFSNEIVVEIHVQTQLVHDEKGYFTLIAHDGFCGTLVSRRL